MTTKFLRPDWMRHSRLGRGRRKLQKWRRPRGRHSKIRRKRFGYPLKVMIGFSSPRKGLGEIEGLKPMLVHNIKEISALNKESIAIIAKRVGAKSKIEMIKVAQQKGIKIANIGCKK